jgi:hypothetical protein
MLVLEDSRVSMTHEVLHWTQCLTGLPRMHVLACSLYEKLILVFPWIITMLEEELYYLDKSPPAVVRGVPT